jgi:8-oxo-dGTP pyrophosphatase MutT (NUDIX family)
MLSAALKAGLLSSALGYAKSSLLTQSTHGPIQYGAAAGLGGIAAGTSLLKDMVRNRLRGPIASSSAKTIDETPEVIKRIASNPDVQDSIEKYTQARWLPWQGLEAGATGGLLGGAAMALLSGSKPGSYLGGGAAIGAGLGGLIGVISRYYQKKKMLSKIQDAYSEEEQKMPKVAADIWLKTNNLKNPTQVVGGRPISASNALFMKGNNLLDYVSAGLIKKVAIDLEARKLCNSIDIKNLYIYGICKAHEKLAQNIVPPSNPNTAAIQNFIEKQKQILQKKMQGNKPPTPAPVPASVPEKPFEPKLAAELPKLRSRAEAIIYTDGDGGKSGVFCIDKGTYILFPGGGIDTGETPEQAVTREAIEEADLKLLNIQLHKCVDALHDKPLMPGYDGERSYLFLALSGGTVGTDHEDREPFKIKPFTEIIQRLDELIADTSLEWAKDLNTTRKAMVEEAEKLQHHMPKKLAHTKTADTAQTLRKQDVIAFTPEGKLVIRRGPNRRVEFLPELPGARPVPYEDPIRYVPAEGVPEQGVHGYDISLQTGETPNVPEGYEAVDPHEALKSMYGSMGLSANKPYRNWDRTRVRAILRLLKKRKPIAQSIQPIQSEAVSPTIQQAEAPAV